MAFIVSLFIECLQGCERVRQGLFFACGDFQVKSGGGGGESGLGEGRGSDSLASPDVTSITFDEDEIISSISSLELS